MLHFHNMCPHTALWAPHSLATLESCLLRDDIQQCQHWFQHEQSIAKEMSTGRPEPLMAHGHGEDLHIEKLRDPIALHHKCDLPWFLPKAERAYRNELLTCPIPRKPWETWCQSCHPSDTENWFTLPVPFHPEAHFSLLMWVNSPRAHRAPCHPVCG